MGREWEPLIVTTLLFTLYSLLYIFLPPHYGGGLGVRVTLLHNLSLHSADALQVDDHTEGTMVGVG